MRILVTGANGYVGKCLVSLLKENGHELITTSRTKTKGNKCHFYGSINDSEFISKIGKKIKKVDAVIHSAALLNSNTKSKIVNVNVNGTLEIMRLSEMLSAKQFYYISTFAMFDLSQKGVITENEKVLPSTRYGMSKYLAEQAVIAYKEFSGCRKIFRIPSPIAPNISSDKIFGKFIKNAKLNINLEIFGDGNRTQNYLDLRELKAIILSSFSNDMSGIWNLAGQELYSDLKLAENIIKVTESRSKIVFISKPGLKQESMRKIDTSKIEIDFNFKHKFSIMETILWVSKFTGKKYA